jgi:hypothetical protein
VLSTSAVVTGRHHKLLLSSLSFKHGKIELPVIVSLVCVDLKLALGAIVAAVLFFFGIIFAMASAYAATRLLVAAFLFTAGIVVVAVVYVMTRKPKTVIQQLELSGEMKAVALKCPQCSASVEPTQIKIVDGVPFATCKYCGHMFEVAEEPKW